MIGKRKLAIVVAGVLLLAGVAFGRSVNNRDGLKSDILNAHGRVPEVYAWYSNEQWTCDGTTVSRPVQCISVKTGKQVPESSCTDTKPESSFSPFSGGEGAPSTCEQILSHLHNQRTYSAFREDVCTSYPDVCRALDKSNNKQPLYFSNARKTPDIGAVTTKAGWNVLEYSGAILSTKDAGMVLNSLSYEISNYNPDTLKIGNIKLYDSITTVDSLNQFYCTQEYQKNTKKLLITCSLTQPKKTVFTFKESRGYTPLYLLFDVLKSETSNKVMQLKFTGGVYNGKQTNWNDQTYPVKFKTLNETDYCAQNPDRCETTADITVLSPNGGETFIPGQHVGVQTQNSDNKEHSISYYLIPSPDTLVPANTTLVFDKDAGGYHWGGQQASTPSSFGMVIPQELPVGTYKLRAYIGEWSNDLGSPTPQNAWNFDDSDNFFTISASTTSYSWQVGAWGKCTNDIQTRLVTCQNDSGIIVTDLGCPRGKPSEQKSCSTDVATYEIMYDINGASGVTPSTQTKKQNIPLTLASTTNILTPNGYTFAGWNIAADGSGTNYAPGASYTADVSATFFAKWVSVTFD